MSSTLPRLVPALAGLWSAALVLAGLITLLQPTPAAAASPVDVFQFETEQQRERYRALIEELRCPKCLNTNIAGSDAPIAQDLRAAVHRLVVVEGLTDAEVLAFMQERYGDFVLYDPPFAPRTWLLWLMPVGVGMIILGALWRIQRRARHLGTGSGGAEQRDRLQALLDQD